MRIIFRFSDFGFRIDRQNKGAVPLGIRNPQSAVRNRSAFTLVEVMVVIVLLSLIVMALMAVFNSTQTAFRASITQTDVLESGRAAMDLMTGDLRAMSPSLGVSNGAVNFSTVVPAGHAPMVQPLVSSSPPQSRTNGLNTVFILSRDNTTWTGVGYAVNASSSSPLYPLYRFSMSTNIAAASPSVLYKIFTNDVYIAAWTNMSHLMDGVVGLTVRAYDVNGGLMTNNLIPFVNGQTTNYVFNQNALYYPPAWGQVGVVMFSNTLPASVEVEMGVLEDRALQRAESLGGSFPAQSNYLAGSAGRVHIFRQRVSIPNVDPAAYQ